MEGEERAKKLAIVKKEIRALLISSKSGRTPRQLSEDYLLAMGKNLPYQSFGYKNCLSFISLNKTTLYGVADSKTKKIQQLVSKQRTTKSSKLMSQWTTVGPRLDMVIKQEAAPCSATKEPAVPDTFKQKLKELTLSYPNGISLKDFNEAFAKRYQHYIAYRNWGFKSIESMIKSVPDVLCLHEDKLRNMKIVKRVPLQLKGPSEESKKSHSSMLIDWYYLNKQKEEEEEEKRRKEEQEKEIVTISKRGKFRLVIFVRRAEVIKFIYRPCERS